MQFWLKQMDDKGFFSINKMSVCECVCVCVLVCLCVCVCIRLQTDKVKIIIDLAKHNI